MIKRLALVLAALSLFALTACATSIPVRIRRAPELNLVGVKTLEVQPFKVSGNLDLDVVEGGKGLLGAVTDVAVGVGMNKLGERQHPGLRSQHVDGLRSVIVRDGYYKVVSGGEKDAVLQGEVVYDVTDSGEEGTVTETENDKKVERKVYTLTRRAVVTVRLTVVAKDGNVLGSTDVVTEVRDQVTAGSRNQARDDIANWDKLVRQGITEAQRPTLERIAPYFVTETRTLAKGDSDVIKEANKTAAKGQWESAARMWSDAGRSGTGDDKVASAYNLGVYAEVEGRLEDALKQFQEASAAGGGSKYAGDVARVETRMAEEARIRAARSAPATSGS